MNRPAHLASPALFAGFTPAEFLRMVDAGAFFDLRVELVAGEIVKMLPAYPAHGEASMRLGAKLLAAFGDTARVAADLMVTTGQGTIRAADIAVVRNDAPRDRPVDAADLLLVVEIAGASLAEDLGPKLADYARIGIPDYWVLDLGSASVHVMAHPRGDTYAKRVMVRFGEPLAVPGTDATIVID